MMMASLDEEPLPESKLGTKQYWDNTYAREVSTFESIGDEGEVWFGEDSVERMIRYLVEVLEESPFPAPPRVLDLGMGNGHLLFGLLEAAEELPAGTIVPEHLRGVDYSPASVQLAQCIGKKRGDGCEKVPFEEADLCDQHTVSRLVAAANDGKGWDIVCDKGTIALSSKPVNGVLPVDQYTQAVQQLTRAPEEAFPEGGLFFITSCNFTQQELERRFTGAGLTVEKVIPTPSFTFGGQKGSTVTTIAFRRTQ